MYDREAEKANLDHVKLNFCCYNSPSFDNNTLFMEENEILEKR